jgi:hypothetical protein
MKHYVNDIRLADGDETVLHGNTSFQTSYVLEGEQIYHMRHLDFVIEIDHTGLLELIEKASQAKNKKFAEGPLLVRVDNVKDSEP